MYGNTHDAPAAARVPDGERDYLAKAAELLDKVSDNNERRYQEQGTRLELADRYAELAAIQRGQMPARLAKLMFEQFNGQKERDR